MVKPFMAGTPEHSHSLRKPLQATRAQDVRDVAYGTGRTYELDNRRGLRVEHFPDAEVTRITGRHFRTEIFRLSPRLEADGIVFEGIPKGNACSLASSRTVMSPCFAPQAKSPQNRLHRVLLHQLVV